jgi:hypothetical protein
MAEVKSKWVVILLTASMTVTLTGCRDRINTPEFNPAQARATTSGHVAGWDVTLQVAPSMPAGEKTTAKVDAVNSSDTSLSTGPLMHLQISDSSGKLVSTGSWSRYRRVSETKGPGSRVYFRLDFTVPPPGRYSVSIQGMRDKMGHSAASA